MTDKELVTILPDGSAFFTASLLLPKNHWLYAERVYEKGAEDPIELGRPILSNDKRDAVKSAIRYAIRSATNCGKEKDFDPDALVLNAAYALCGSASAPSHCEWQGLTDEEIRNEANHHVFDESFFNGAVWARGKIKEKNNG